MKSYSKQGFHVVLPGKGGKYSCDCPNYHSLNICSHTVAVAEISQSLPQFIEYYRKSKKLPSLTSLTAVNSTGSGHKGGKPPRKKRAKEAVTIRIPVTEDTCNASQDETNSVMNSIQGERNTMVLLLQMWMPLLLVTTFLVLLMVSIRHHHGITHQLHFNHHGH